MTDTQQIINAMAVMYLKTVDSDKTITCMATDMLRDGAWVVGHSDDIENDGFYWVVYRSGTLIGTDECIANYCLGGEDAYLSVYWDGKRFHPAEDMIG